MNATLYAQSLLGGSALKKSDNKSFQLTIPQDNKTTHNPNESFTFPNHTGGFTTIYIAINDTVAKNNQPKGVEITLNSMVSPILNNCPKGSYSKSYISTKGLIDTVIFLKNRKALNSSWKYEMSGTTGYSYITEYCYKGILKKKTIKNQRFENVMELEQKLYSCYEGKKELTLFATSWYVKGFGLIDRVVHTK